MPKLRLNSPYLTASSLRNYVKSIDLEVSHPDGHLPPFVKLKKKLLGMHELIHYPQLLTTVNYVLKTTVTWSSKSGHSN